MVLRFSKSVLYLFMTLLIMLLSLGSNARAYGGLIENGDFENGHTSWDEFKWNGSSLTPTSDIIVNGNNGGGGNYYVYLFSSGSTNINDVLFTSNNFVLPDNVDSLNINYDSRFVSGDCVTGFNEPFVGIWDVTAGESAGSAAMNNANTDPNESIYSTHVKALGSGLSSRAGHEFYVNFTFLNDDPNCYQLFYLDNISLHAGTPVYRFYNYKQGAHFYTSNFSEYKNILTTSGNTFRYEGVSYSVRPSMESGTIPVHRFYNFKQGVHFYTSNQAEATNINNNLYTTFRYEGVSYYAFK